MKIIHLAPNVLFALWNPVKELSEDLPLDNHVSFLLTRLRLCHPHALIYMYAAKPILSNMHWDIHIHLSPVQLHSAKNIE